MKTIFGIMLLTLLVSCGKKTTPKTELSQAQSLTQKECLQILVNNVSNLTVSVDSDEYVIQIHWMTVEHAQWCQRPLDIYLQDTRVGAFVNFTSLNTYDDLSQAIELRSKIFVQLKSQLKKVLYSLGIHETRLLVAGDEIKYPYEEMNLWNQCVEPTQ